MHLIWHQTANYALQSALWTDHKVKAMSPNPPPRGGSSPYSVVFSVFPVDRVVSGVNVDIILVGELFPYKCDISTDEIKQ